MTYTDQTADFRSLIAGPSSKCARSPTRESKRSRRQTKQDPEFLKEAYRIHHHLHALSVHLQSIRKPYLSITEPPISRRKRAEAAGDDFAQWDGVKYLSDRDREEIDQKGKMILRRCRERVGILEDGEKARQLEVAPPPSTLFTFLPSLRPQPASTADAVLTAHRSAVVLTLSTLLTRTTAELSTLQEERSKRRAERGRTLGEGAEREAQQPMTLPQVAENLDLSQAQIQAFESENNALINHLESTLSSVLKAERSLLEVSELQTQLVQQLVQQTEMVDLLYEQAVGSVGQMRGAEQQLKKAKERGGEARFFLLIFLIGASLALLFLDWYS